MKVVVKKPSSPEDVAFGMRKTQLGWQTVQYTIKDGKVVEEKVSEPDLRSVALEKYRKLTAFFWYF